MKRKPVDNEQHPQVKAMLERMKEHNKHMMIKFKEWLDGKRKEKAE